MFGRRLLGIDVDPNPNPSAAPRLDTTRPTYTGWNTHAKTPLNNEKDKEKEKSLFSLQPNCNSTQCPSTQRKVNVDDSNRSSFYKAPPRFFETAEKKTETSVPDQSERGSLFLFSSREKTPFPLTSDSLSLFPGHPNPVIVTSSRRQNILLSFDALSDTEEVENPRPWGRPVLIKTPHPACVPFLDLTAVNTAEVRRGLLSSTECISREHGIRRQKGVGSRGEEGKGEERRERGGDLAEREELREASRKGNMSIVLSLILSGVLASNDEKGRTPLHFATLANQVDIVRLLVRSAKGLDINAQTSLGCTALHWAVSKGYEEIADIILGAHALTDISSHLQRTPLHVAVSNNNFAMSALLLQYHALKSHLPSLAPAPVLNEPTEGVKEGSHSTVPSGSHSTPPMHSVEPRSLSFIPSHDTTSTLSPSKEGLGQVPGGALSPVKEQSEDTLTNENKVEKKSLNTASGEGVPCPETGEQRNQTSLLLLSMKKPRKNLLLLMISPILPPYVQQNYFEAKLRDKFSQKAQFLDTILLIIQAQNVPNGNFFSPFLLPFAPRKEVTDNSITHPINSQLLACLPQWRELIKQLSNEKKGAFALTRLSNSTSSAKDLRTCFDKALGAQCDCEECVCYGSVLRILRLNEWLGSLFALELRQYASGFLSSPISKSGNSANLPRGPLEEDINTGYPGEDRKCGTEILQFYFPNEGKGESGSENRKALSRNSPTHTSFSEGYPRRIEVKHQRRHSHHNHSLSGTTLPLTREDEGSQWYDRKRATGHSLDNTTFGIEELKTYESPFVCLNFDSRLIERGMDSPKKLNMTSQIRGKGTHMRANSKYGTLPLIHEEAVRGEDEGVEDQHFDSAFSHFPSLVPSAIHSPPHVLSPLIPKSILSISSPPIVYQESSASPKLSVSHFSTFSPPLSSVISPPSRVLSPSLSTALSSPSGEASSLSRENYHEELSQCVRRCPVFARSYFCLEMTSPTSLHEKEQALVSTALLLFAFGVVLSFKLQEEDESGETRRLVLHTTEQYLDGLSELRVEMEHFLPSATSFLFPRVFSPVTKTNLIPPFGGASMSQAILGIDSEGTSQVSSKSVHLSSRLIDLQGFHVSEHHEIGGIQLNGRCEDFGNELSFTSAIFSPVRQARWNKAGNQNAMSLPVEGVIGLEKVTEDIEKEQPPPKTDHVSDQKYLTVARVGEGLPSTNMMMSSSSRVIHTHNSGKPITPNRQLLSSTIKTNSDATTVGGRESFSTSEPLLTSETRDEPLAEESCEVETDTAPLMTHGRGGMFVTRQDRYNEYKMEKLRQLELELKKHSISKVSSFVFGSLSQIIQVSTTMKQGTLHHLLLLKMALEFLQSLQNLVQ